MIITDKFLEMNIKKERKREIKTATWKKTSYSVQISNDRMMMIQYYHSMCLYVRMCLFV